MPIEPEKGQDAMIGQLIGGRYRVTGVLGEGGMGIVYVGEQQMGSTVRKVAIKTLHAHLSKDPSVLQRFHRECGTVAQLEHPNTIKFFDFGATQDGTLYIAMEFVAGKPLSDVITQQGPLAPDRVTKIMRQVCGALDEAHLQGIIHRDLKPDNIVLTDRAGETDFVKVLDFGIAARRESADAQKEQKLTQQGMVLGTPPYMSPEQFTGKALDARSDIYSLGVMSYEMLAGKLPFNADTPWQWATQHMSVQPTPFEVAAPSRDLPLGMRQAIMKSLEKDREKRQPTAREFFAELSGGGRMTVTGDPPVAGGAKHSDTAAMPMPPDFSQPAPVFPPAPGHHAPMASHPHVPATAPAVVAAVPPAPRHQKSGGGKGLVIGLGVVGVGLLGAMAVIAARSSKTNANEPTTLTIPTSTTPSAGATDFAPLATSPTPTTPVPTAAVEGTGGTPAVKNPSTGTTTGSGTSTGPKPGAGGSGAKPSGGGGDACDACISGASGNVIVAASQVGKCTDEAKKKTCITKIKGAAPDAAKAAALNGKCDLAQAIKRTAEGVGAGTRRLTDAVKTCK
jgi:serine/threonine-protein kinase